ncbi:alpha/beta hydrolase family protein [Emticicia agri]|uniref:Uncharacterized protein n=1 Tax=Emticicia agri TaxID=2492393 RepID=A0A4Q5LWE0_9BACT|nr:lipase family protein [Emticicia agri]RYU93867.1 hypothetical protein EWM59_19700 [Emticicia agri]
MKKVLYISVLTFLIGGSCKKDGELTPKTCGTLIAFEEKGHLSIQQIIANVDQLSVQDIAKHEVTLYAITYRTECRGEQIDTKGLIMVPDNVSSAYLIAYFHGTQLPVHVGSLFNVDNTVPSNYSGGSTDFSEIRNMGLTWASGGYTVFLPDYIGYGSTHNREHPYLNYPEMFKSNIDGLLATKAFLEGKGIDYDNRLFLSGWSQGGAACLSAHKYIQEAYSSQFNVVASSGLAGPYHFIKFIDDILLKKNEDSDIINIFSWSIYALNKFSPSPRPTDQIFSYPVFDQYAAIFAPSKKPKDILNNFFLSKIVDGTDTRFRSILENNTFSAGWKPVGKVFLHHGDSDKVVPYSNSIDAKNGLQAAGGDIKFYTYSGGGHDTNLKEYITNTLNDFNLLK